MVHVSRRPWVVSGGEVSASRLARLRRGLCARRVWARSACAFYESHALRAWMLVFACGCSSSSRWQPCTRTRATRCARGCWCSLVAARALLDGCPALGRYFLPSAARLCDAACWQRVGVLRPRCRFPSTSDGPFRTRTPTPRGVGRTHERLSSRGSVLCLCPPARTLVVCVLCVRGWFLSASP